MKGIFADGDFRGTHYYWDADDREYEITAVWHFERSYPEMPDSWHLLSIEVEDDAELNKEDLDLIRKSVEKDGPPPNMELNDEGY